MPMSLSLFGSHILSSSDPEEEIKHFLRPHKYTSSVILSDTHVYPLYGQKILKTIRQSGLPAEAIIIEAGEESKNLSAAETCWTKMHALGLDRKSLVVGLGGGVITDLSGFVASCYMRGIENILIPTSLMAMADAAIGGKTGVNLPQGKNMIGTFHQPKLVLISPSFLASLPHREICSGLAEVIKCAVIWDKSFFEYLEANLAEILGPPSKGLEHLIERSAAIKAEIVKKDEKEQGLRAILNWGHTFAHALESITAYRTFLHGEAVAIGMCCASRASLQLGLTDKQFVDRVERLCKCANLPVRLPEGIDPDQMIKLMTGDKKSVSGKIHLILSRGLGQAEVYKHVEPSVIRKSLDSMRS